MKKLFLLGMVVVSLLPACTWVKPTPEAANVHVVGETNLTNCERLGWVEVAVRAELVLDIQRSPQKVKTELETLARNQAAKRAADSIIATSQIQNGKQTFDIYRCR